MPRLIEHLNTASNGPVGVEHLIPVSSGENGGWFSQFVNLPPDGIASLIQNSWTSESPTVQKIARALASFGPRSIYHLPCEWAVTHVWLLFETEQHVLYIPEPSSANSGLDSKCEVVELIRCFDGYQFGYNPHPEDDFLRCDSGFHKLSDLRLINSDCDAYLWGDDETVLGGYWFFTTNCGNRLYCRQDGTIAKWNHESCEITDAFTTCDEFADSFIQHYIENRSNELSPLFF
jgi:hypothetical protein